MQGIYRIRNILNDKRYVGSAQDFGKRWDIHIKELQEGMHYNSYLQNAWNKYGEENFAFEIEEEVEGNREILITCEQDYLDKGFELGILYNIARRAGGGNLGPEVNKLLGEKSKEWLRTHKNPFKGKHHTEEWKRGQSERSKARSGKNHPNYGKSPSQETRDKIGKANTGKKRTKEQREKTSKTLTGRKLTEQHKENTRLGVLRYYETHEHAQKGKSRSAEFCAKVSKALQGHPAWNKGIKTGPRSKEENLERVRKMKERDTLGQPYPAFYNIETEEYIPAGRNLKQMCSDYGLSYYKFTDINLGNTKVTRDGWRIANEGDM